MRSDYDQTIIACEFAYTEAELLGMSEVVDTALGREKAGPFSAGFSLAWYAILCLSEQFPYPHHPQEKEMLAFERIASSTKDLVALLENYFMNMDEAHSMYGGIYLTDHEQSLRRVLPLLREFRAHEQAVREVVHQRTRKFFDNSANPPFRRFIYKVLGCWKHLTGLEPGGGKQGGPAAKFLFHAANPVIDYARERLEINLRPRAKEAFSEAAAGELIHAMKSAMRREGIAQGDYSRICLVKDFP